MHFLQKEKLLSRTKRLSTSIETINEETRRFSVTSKSSISSRQSRLSILSVSEETSAEQVFMLHYLQRFSVTLFGELFTPIRKFPKLCLISV